MELLVGLVAGAFIGAAFADQMRWGFRFLSGGYLFRTETEKQAKDDAKP